jgi:hypothetical protein
MNQDQFEEICLVLENERYFHDAYHEIENSTSKGVDYARRCLIVKAYNNYCPLVAGILMVPDQAKIMQHFNERYELSPYRGPREASATPIQPTQPVQPIQKAPDTMTILTPAQAAAPVSQVTFIYGKPASEVTDAAIFDMIAGIETQIASFEGIKNKPAKLHSRITALQGEIDALMALVDAR